MFLASLTWSEFKNIASDSLVAVIPLGSTEQHVNFFNDDNMVAQ